MSINNIKSFFFFFLFVCFVVVVSFVVQRWVNGSLWSTVLSLKHLIQFHFSVVYINALRKVNMRSTPSLTNVPTIAVETVPGLIYASRHITINTDGEEGTSKSRMGHWPKDKDPVASNGSLTKRQGSCCLEWVTDRKTRILLPRMGHWPKDKDSVASNGSLTKRQGFCCLNESLTERQGFCCLEWVTDRKTRILLPRMGHWLKNKDSVASNGSLTERQGFCCLE